MTATSGRGLCAATFDGKIRAVKRSTTLTLLRAKAVDLVTCPYCAGWWIAGAVVAVYVATVGVYNGWWPFAFSWAGVAGGQVVVWRVVEEGVRG